MTAMVLLMAKARKERGKQSGALRKAGVLPAVLYGAKTPAESIAINLREFEKVWRTAGETSLVELEMDGKTKNVLIKDVQQDPLRGTPLHADFYVVEMDKAIRAKIPVQFVGESPAVKQGAILVKVIHEIEVEALPANLPRVIEVDISALASVGNRFLISDLKLPVGVFVIADAADIVVLTEEPKAEEEAVAEAPTLADIEVVGEKGKKEEEEPATEGEKEAAPAKEKE